MPTCCPHALQGVDWLLEKPNHGQLRHARTPTLDTAAHSRPSSSRLRTLLLLFVVLGSSLAVFGAWGIVVFGLVVGLAIYLHHAESLSSLAVSCLGLVLPAVPARGCCCPLSILPARRAAGRHVPTTYIKSRWRCIVYHQANGCFPPAYIADKNGKPMHSWRVLILPHMDLDDLYKLYNFTNPGTARKTRQLSAHASQVFPCPSDPHCRASRSIQTSYLAVVGPNAAWAGEKPRKLADFGKDAADTIMLIEVTNSGISWAEPRDLSLDTLGAADGKSPALVLTSDHGRREEFFFTYDHVPGVHVVMADGIVRFLRTGNRSPEDLRKVLQIGGYKEEGHASSSGDNRSFYGEPRRLNWPNIAALAVWLLSVGTLLTHAVRSRKVRSVPPPAS